MVVSFLDAFCWWGVCVCLLLFIQDIVVGWDSAKIRAVEKSTSRGTSECQLNIGFLYCSFLVIFFFKLELEFNICVFSLNFFMCSSLRLRYVHFIMK
jgi:hypothetical protein